MRKSRCGFTMVDLLGGVAAIALMLAIGVPAMSRAKELSKRMVCATNLAGIGATAKIYVGENNGQWMVPPFKNATIDAGGTDYTNGGAIDSSSDPGSVGWQRQFVTVSETPSQPGAGTTANSVTRAYWMLVRSGRVHREQFICPSTNDQVDPTTNVDLYYDFSNYRNISYGYQVPFGPSLTRARENADPRQIFAADKSPFYVVSNVYPKFEGPRGLGLTLNDPPKDWRAYNSNNHGGQKNGEGQNCLYADSHVSFQRVPTAGIDHENIYTVIENYWQSTRFNLMHGGTVWTFPTQNPYPGMWAFGEGANKYAFTDSLIYP